MSFFITLSFGFTGTCIVIFRAFSGIIFSGSQYYVKISIKFYVAIVIKVDRARFGPCATIMEWGPATPSPDI